MHVGDIDDLSASSDESCYPAHWLISSSRRALSEQQMTSLYGYQIDL
jgi:hypothetical protein